MYNDNKHLITQNNNSKQLLKIITQSNSSYGQQSRK